MGLAVNIASRLQASTRELNNNVIVSQSFLQKNYQNKTNKFKRDSAVNYRLPVGPPFKN